MTNTNTNYQRLTTGFKTKGVYVRWYKGKKGFESVYPIWVNGVKKSREKAFPTKDEAIAFCKERDREIIERGKMSSILLDADEQASLDKLKRKFPNLSLTAFIERFMPFLESDWSNSTVRQVFSNYLERIELKRKETGSTSNYINDCKSRIKTVNSAFGGRLASSISPNEFRNWLVNLTTKDGKDASTAYKNTILTMVKSAFKACHLTNLDAVLKISDKLHKNLEESRNNIKIYTVAECQEILKLFVRCRDLQQYLPLLVWQMFTGGRNSECIGCVTSLSGSDRYNKSACPKWADVLPHLKDETVESQILLFCPKKQTRKKVTLTPILKQWLNFARRLTNVDEYNFLAPDDTKVNTLSRAIKSAHIRYSNNIFRHTHISYQLALTDNPELVARQHGHDVDMTINVYDEVTTKDNAIQFFNLFPETVLDSIKITHARVYNELLERLSTKSA